MRVFLSIFLVQFAVGHFLALSPKSSAASLLKDCDTQSNSLLTWLDNSISQSALAEPLQLSCADVAQISSYSVSQVVMTSGRRRGQYVVCLSDDPDNPCKHVVAKLLGYEAPSVQLQKVFSLPEKKSEHLNETVERLFFKPSKLIR